MPDWIYKHNCGRNHQMQTFGHGHRGPKNKWRVRVKYYVYFDAYGHARQIVDEKRLAAEYHNDTQQFLKAMCCQSPETGIGHTTGHVGTLSFDDENDLYDYLESLGDEITGFYSCRSDSRPYNF
jgi:hypothetical protein